MNQLEWADKVYEEIGLVCTESEREEIWENTDFLRIQKLHTCSFEPEEAAGAIVFEYRNKK